MTRANVLCSVVCLTTGRYGTPHVGTSLAKTGRCGRGPWWLADTVHVPTNGKTSRRHPASPTHGNWDQRAVRYTKPTQYVRFPRSPRGATPPIHGAGKFHGSAADVPADRRGPAGSYQSGTLEQGAQLPTELELRDRYASSRNTIRDAIKRLTMWGLVETRPGQGTFVTQQIHPFTFVLRGAGTEDDDLSELDVYVSRKESVGRYLAVTDTRVGIQGATEELATQLRITLGEPVISRQQMLTIDGVPWALQTIYYPMEFVTNGALRLIQAASIERGKKKKKRSRSSRVARTWLCQPSAIGPFDPPTGAAG